MQRCIDDRNLCRHLCPEYRAVGISRSFKHDVAYSSDATSTATYLRHAHTPIAFCRIEIASILLKEDVFTSSSPGLTYLNLSSTNRERFQACSQSSQISGH